MDFNFPKNEKLKSRKLIERLFAEGKSVSKYPLRLVFMPLTEAGISTQAGFSVSKRTFKKAVNRNQVKRLMREAYRLNKNEALSTIAQPYAFMFLFTGKEIPSFENVNKTMVQLLRKFTENTQNQTL